MQYEELNPRGKETDDAMAHGKLAGRLHRAEGPDQLFRARDVRNIFWPSVIVRDRFCRLTSEISNETWPFLRPGPPGRTAAHSPRALDAVRTVCGARPPGCAGSDAAPSGPGLRRVGGQAVTGRAISTVYLPSVMTSVFTPVSGNRLSTRRLSSKAAAWGSPMVSNSQGISPARHSPG